MRLLDDARSEFNVDNLYQVLGISEHSTSEEIKKAYLERSLKLHPDKATDPSQEEELKTKFQILSQVYKLLSDKQARLDYDRHFKTKYLNLKADGTHLILDEINVKECHKLGDIYYYDCRCSGKFIVKQELISPSRDIDACVVECDSCSSSIKMIFD